MANTRIPIFNADAQTAYIDYEQDATDGDGRQVVVIGHPSVKVAVAEVASLDVGASSTAYGQVVRLAGSAQVNLVAVSSGVTLGVRVGVIEGTIGVRVGQIDGSIAVHLIGTGGTLGVRVGQIDGTTAVFLQGTGGTLGVRVGQVDGSVAVYFSQASPAVKLVDSAGANLINIQAQAGASAGNAAQVFGGQYNTNLGVNPTAGQPVFLQTDASARIIVGNIVSSIGVNLGKVDGTIQVRIDPGYNVVNTSSTIILPVTVSTTTSGVSASGVQVVAPEAGHNIKVFAYSIQTTGAVSMAIKFTNGAGTSPTEFWRPLVTASGVTGVQGANLAVTPPGYLFATGANTTLAIVNDSASLIHYSVAYFKESA